MLTNVKDIGDKRQDDSSDYESFDDSDVEEEDPQDRVIVTMAEIIRVEARNMGVDLSPEIIRVIRSQTSQVVNTEKARRSQLEEKYYNLKERKRIQDHVIDQDRELLRTLGVSIRGKAPRVSKSRA